jgi:hypothetical protein
MALGCMPMRSENSYKTKTDVAQFSETYLKPHMRFYIPNYDNQTDHEEGTKVELPQQLRKASLTQV